MPLKGGKKKSYNKKYYKENKEKIAEKKKAKYEEVEKSQTDSAAQSWESYQKNPEKCRASLQACVLRIIDHYLCENNSRIIGWLQE